MFPFSDDCSLFLKFDFFQWISKIRSSESMLNPDKVELMRHKIMLIVKFYHEAQNKATENFLKLRPGFSSDGSTSKRPRTSETLHSTPAAAVKPILEGSPSSQVSQDHMKFKGEVRGDSGYALEEELLGGRLRHRHLDKLSGFQVSRLPCD